jgi:hypothetical protein
VECRRPAQSPQWGAINTGEQWDWPYSRRCQENAFAYNRDWRILLRIALMIDIYWIPPERAMSVPSIPAGRQIVHFLTFLILAAAFVFVFSLSLVKMIWDLLQPSIHESPGILETSEPPSGEDQPSDAI